MRMQIWFIDKGAIFVFATAPFAWFTKNEYTISATVKI